MPKATFDLRAWALVGAQQRLRELDEERAAIYATFPEFRTGAANTAPLRRGPRRKNQVGATAASELATSGSASQEQSRVRRRKRRKMSKEARAKIAAAQRARWAKQKASIKKR